jgi:UDP-glucose 4-epimerase
VPSCQADTTSPGTVHASPLATRITPFAHAVLLQFVRGDIQSIDLLSFVLASEKIDTVMHFAAQVSFQS